MIKTRSEIAVWVRSKALWVNCVGEEQSFFCFVLFFGFFLAKNRIWGLTEARLIFSSSRKEKKITV